MPKPGRFVARAEKWFIEDRETGFILCEVAGRPGVSTETLALNLAADLNKANGLDADWFHRAEDLRSIVENARNALANRPRGGAEYWVVNLREALWPTTEGGHMSPKGGHEDQQG